MKKSLFALALISLLASACINISAPQPTPGGDTVATIVASTMLALTPAASPTQPAPPTQAPPSGTPVSFQHVSFVIPQGLALGANPTAVPELSGEDAPPWEMAPAYVQFNFFGYDDLTAKFDTMELFVFPAQKYIELNVGASISIPLLQAILAAPQAPITDDAMPRIPPFNAGPMFHGQIKVIGFTDGSGVREITQYGQAVGPASNGSLFYHFQGLTSDGKYYIIAILPISAPFIHPQYGGFGGDPNAHLPADGVPYPAINSINPADYADYFNAITDKLNAADPSVFSPTLSLLDALISSIAVAQ